MIFYSYRCKLAKKEEKADAEKKTQNSELQIPIVEGELLTEKTKDAPKDSQLVSRIAKRIEDYIFKLHDNKFLAFPSNYTSEDFTLSCCIRGGVDCLNEMDEHVKKIIKKTGEDVVSITRSECFVSKFLDDLDIAYGKCWINNMRAIDRDYKLRDLRSPLFYECELSKSDAITKADAMAEAQKSILGAPLKNELERIFVKNEKGFGVPVHYILDIYDKAPMQDTLNLLLHSLKANGRIIRDKYAVIDLNSLMRNMDEPFNDITEIGNAFSTQPGGAVVIKTSLDVRDVRRLNNQHELLYTLCHYIRLFCSMTTVILCFSCRSNEPVKIFKESLCDLSFVELSDFLLAGSRAEIYLKDLAVHGGTQPDDTLLAKIDPKLSYKPIELQEIYHNWHKEYVKTVQFPQYSCFFNQSSMQNAEAEDRALKELKGLIGLDEVKKRVEEYIDYAKLQKACRERGKKAPNICRHMAFIGNPGTAKTTVARLVAEIMKENHLLWRGHIVEVGRADLVSKYVGGTAPLVKQMFERAMGGVLFIDEAYSLCENREGMYGDEAINTIVQEMENRRDEVVVIFAGYKTEMEEFLSRNPGLRSRIGSIIDFNDYSCDQLVEIAQHYAKENDVDISLCEQTIRDILQKQMSRPDFGNGRFVRTLLEKARIKQATRLVKNDQLFSDEAQILRPEDFDIPAEPPKHTMGFGW